jgi:NAD(P)-dependent dehydrogenase (short-subunit alcohol dehydrogenase family)
LRLFAKAVAMECAAPGDGVRVKHSARGYRHANLDEVTRVCRQQCSPIDPNEVAKAPVLLGTAGQVQTSREWVLFLASDASSYMTGAELVIDGGGMTGARPSLELILTALAATRAGLTFSRCRRDTVGYRR